MNVFSPDGKVKYGSVQLSMNRRMSDGIQLPSRIHTPRRLIGGARPFRSRGTGI